MSKINDGGLAFPLPVAYNPNEERVVTRYDCGDGGMSLRVWLAGRALSHPATHANDACMTSPTEAAQWAYAVADAIIAQQFDPIPSATVDALASLKSLRAIIHDDMTHAQQAFRAGELAAADAVIAKATNVAAKEVQ